MNTQETKNEILKAECEINNILLKLFDKLKHGCNLLNIRLSENIVKDQSGSLPKINIVYWKE